MHPPTQGRTINAQFAGSGTEKVNRAYPEQYPLFSAPDRNENPRIPHGFASNYGNVTIKVKSEETAKPKPDQPFATRFYGPI